MNRKHLTLLALCFVLISTITSCHKKENEETLIYPSFRFGLQQGVTTIEYQTATLFASKVEELSKGTINVKVFPDGQLGDDIQMIKDVMNNTLDFTYTEIGRLGIWFKGAEIFGYPFAFDDFEHLKRTLDTDYGKKLMESFKEKNITVLATGYNGTRQTTSNKPINSLADMKGLRFRVPKAYANLKFAELCGAEPVIVPFNEVYRQLRANLIDAQENPLPTIYSNTFFEVQDCLAITNHIINDNNIIISTESFNLLTDWQKEAVKEAALIAEEYLSESFRTEEKRLLKFFHDYGMTITLPKRSAFRKACIPLYNDYISIYGDEAYKAILSSQTVIE